MTFGKRIKELRALHDMTQAELASKLNVSKANMSKYEADKIEPNLGILKNISALFDVSVDYLLQRPQNSKTGIRIPVLGKVVAGIPIEAVEDILDYEEISPDMASTGEFFALKITGKSMEPKFSEGDVVIVRQQPDVDNGDIAIVLINGHAATVKKIKKSAEGITLIPLNPAFDVLFLTNAEIENMPVTIIGKVIELRAKF